MGTCIRQVPSFFAIFLKESQRKVIRINNNIGIIIETNYNYAYVYLNDEIIEVTLSKNIKGIMNRTVFTGDHVLIKNKKVIEILGRKNILSRNKIDNTKNNPKLNDTIIATNIDLALIVASPNMPKLHPRFIDRYILILNKSNINYKIVINKADLLDEESKQIIEEFQNRGVEVIITSTYSNEGIEKLKKIIKDKQVILVGQSGVGKSSLASTLTENKNIISSHVGDKTERGRHTTTKSSLYKLDDSSFIIDSPGIRAVSIKHLNISDIKDYFKEFDEFTCKYKDCSHINEPINDCGIKKALKTGKISKYRYESYIKLISEIK